MSVRKNIKKDTLDKLKIWWNIAYEKGNTEVYDKCENFCFDLVGKWIETTRFIKTDNHFCNIKVNHLAYIPEHYLDKNGILCYYYTKDDIIRICDENKIIATTLFKMLKGERVEDKYRDLKEQYYQWFLYEESANFKQSKLAWNMYNEMSDAQKREITKVLNVRTGMRYK